jgi:hypothetical protein
MTKRWFSGVVLGWVVVTACGGESARNGTRSVPEEHMPDEQTPDEQTPDEPMPDEASAYEVLTECVAFEPCAETRSFAQLIEAHGKYLDPGVACVFAALRDRAPGRYLHHTDSTWTNGSAGSEHVIVVRPDGSVAYSRDSYASGPWAPADVEEPGQRCALKGQDFFDACYAAVTAPGGDPDAAFTCAYSGSTTSSAPIDWFESCELDAAPSCE